MDTDNESVERPLGRTVRVPVRRRAGALRRGSPVRGLASRWPKPMLRIIGVHRRLGGTTKAFLATAETPDGAELDVCVKPRGPGDIMLQEHHFSNWCGDVVGAALGLPQPEMYLVELEAGMLSQLGPDYAAVRPGPALATRFQDNALTLGLLGFIIEPALIDNGDADVATAVVLDTLFQKTDRGGDVLLVPVERGGVSRYKLCFIDGGWLVWFPFPHRSEPLELQTMTDPLLSRFARNSEDFDPVLFSAEALDHTMLQAFRRCPRAFRDPNGVSPRAVYWTLRARAARLRLAVHAAKAQP